MRRLCTGALLCLFAPFFSGCPIADIPVPDFSPAGDGGSDGSVRPTGDGGQGAWQADKQTATTNELRGVWVADAALTRAYAVGSGGVILDRGGGTWTAEKSGTTQDLNAVVGVSSEEVYAAGGDKSGVILHRVQGTWTAEATKLNLPPIYGLALVGSDVYAVGAEGTIVHKTGNTWATETAPLEVNLHAVYGNTTDVYAAGDTWTDAAGLAHAILHRNSQGAWALDTATLATTDGGDFYGITALGSTLYIAGSYGRVLSRSMNMWRRHISCPSWQLTANWWRWAREGRWYTGMRAGRGRWRTPAPAPN